MTNTPITKLSALDIVPSKTNKNNGLYVPELTDAQRDAIPADTVRTGGIIYNTTAGAFQFRFSTGWKNVGGATYRTGSITDIGDVGATTPAIPALTTTGGIISASKAAGVNNGNLITINYTDLGFVPFIFATWIDSSNFAVYQIVTRPGATATTADFFIEEPPAESGVQVGQMQIMLTPPNVV